MELTAVLSAVVAGLFGLFGGVLLWRLKTNTEKQDRARNDAKERREELKQLYADVIVMFEVAINRIRLSEPVEIDKDLSSTNARVQLLAPQAVIERYEKVAELLNEWARLHELASPRRMSIGDRNYVMLQAPDPTAKYKAPERAAFDALHSALSKLNSEMRDRLANDA